MEANRKTPAANPARRSNAPPPHWRPVRADHTFNPPLCFAMSPVAALAATVNAACSRSDALVAEVA